MHQSMEIKELNKPGPHSTSSTNKPRFDVESKIALAMKKGKTSDLRQLLVMCNSDLAFFSGLSCEDANILKDSIAAQLMESLKPSTAFQMLRDPTLHHWRLSADCPVIDSMLKGGILSGVLTEISGESACGKTQLCLQLCLSVQINKSHSGGAVYICTEDVFPSRRLQQIIKFHPKCKSHKFGDNIYIEHVADFDGLNVCVEQRLPALLARGLVKLVVIDSVAALFRCHYTGAQTMERAQHLAQFASTLHRLAARNAIPIVCVNQVSANMDGQGSTSSRVTPALGLTWANQITCRLMLSRSMGGPVPEVKAMSIGNLPTYRELSVVFAPHLPPSTLPVYIDDSGIHGVGELS